MRKQKNKNEKSTKKKSGKKKNEKRTHNSCRWYDGSTERDFYRKVGPEMKRVNESRFLKVEPFVDVRRQKPLDG